MERKINSIVPIVLIADDVEANRLVLKDIISEMGYQAVLAENGIQALKLAQHIRPQLIILDVAMPEMDGYEACRRLKEDTDTKEIPVIFISALDEPNDIVRGFSLGGEDYIVKPFISEVVKARVGLHLKLYEANHRMTEMNRQLQISIGEQLQKMELERRSVLYALLRVARENACYNEAYMERFSYNCRVLAEAMQLSKNYEHLISDSYIDTIELAAPLCDLGNLAIPTNILQKQGKLTQEEKEIMQTHTTVGARILRDIKGAGTDNRMLQMAVDIANYHHENWDGSGYPEGRKENEIPLSAQIVAVTGIFCALTEHRTYRKSFSREEAFQIMEKDENKKFCPEIFCILKKIMRQLH
ncbi:MAG: response regulator [Lachnospiraceae bacterium]|nr:response regulator [Lachnospiraceae bacterium]